jgi:hypothetical protein
VCELRPLVYYSLGLNNPLRTYAFYILKVACQKVITLRTRVMHDVKWWELDFTHMISSALTPRIGTHKMTILRIATDSSLNLRAECHRPELAACIDAT